jgi:hypothetical protein
VFVSLSLINGIVSMLLPSESLWNFTVGGEEIGFDLALLKVSDMVPWSVLLTLNGDGLKLKMLLGVTTTD